DDGVHGRELWMSDGTGPGTQMVADINAADAGTGTSDPYGFTVYDGGLYFGADDGVHGSELWSSDGTGPGTQLIVDINPGAASGWPAPGRDALTQPYVMSVMNGVMYFTADDGTHGRELWRYDGTAMGT